MMKFGVNVPPFDDFCEPAVLVEMAREAEEAGWDGFFIWDHMIFDDLWHAMVDPFVVLAAIAAQTTTIWLGTMITPPARRRPWKVARETVGIDRLSNGRFTLGVGLGDPAVWEYGFFHEETDAKIRAAKLDEGLDILAGLWSGDMFGYQGKHYQLEEMRFVPTPVQEPRIPIWVGGYWPRKRPFRRAALWDGVCPGGVNGPLTPDDWRDLLAYIEQHRQHNTPFDAVGGGVTPGDDLGKAADMVAPYMAAGVTWWVEDLSPYGRGLGWSEPWTADLVAQLRERLRQGPPRM